MEPAAKYPCLIIISHTPHFLDQEGRLVGWSPTVREINHLMSEFREIIHIAPFHRDAMEGYGSAYVEGVRFVGLAPAGGRTISDKLAVIATIPKNLLVIHRTLRERSGGWCQVRLPANIGMYVLPYFYVRRLSRLWIKYAGNWKEPNPPWTYALQRWVLERNFLRCKVTINGRWPGQAEHIISFENPCLTEREYQAASKYYEEKNYHGRLTLCFVGALHKAKGAMKILEAVRALKDSAFIEKVVIVGDGAERSVLARLAQELTIPVIFKGFLERESVSAIYAESHLIILPSNTEGFPKVIAEAAAYGCVSIVSDISSIGQYIRHRENGMLLKQNTPAEIADCILFAGAQRDVLRKMAGCARLLAADFTFEHYNERIRNEIVAKG